MLKFAVKKTSKDIFHDAVASKDISRLRFLLQNNRLGFEVDELDDDGLTALQRSCFIGNLKLVQLLVAYGANIHIQDNEGWSVLHASAVAGNYSILRYLVCMGSDVAVRNDLGQLPIDLASNLYCIIILLEAMVKAGHSDLIEKYFTQRPSLKGVIEHKLGELTNETTDASLIDISLERNIEGENDDNQLQSNQLSIVLNSSQEKQVNTTSSSDSLGDLWSTFNKELQVRLNEGGGKTEESGIRTDKRTPKRAVCKKCKGKKRFSSASSSSSDSSISSYDSAYTSLHSEGNANGMNNTHDESTFIDLLEQTVNSTKHRTHNCKKKDHHKPSRLTTSLPNELLLEKIKEINDVNALNSSGLSLLHVTASQGDVGSVKMLLEKGAEVNRQALNGSSPLHEAAKSGQLDCTMLLLRYGADVFADDDNGLLPIDFVEDKKLKHLLHGAMAMK